MDILRNQYQFCWFFYSILTFKNFYFFFFFFFYKHSKFTPPQKKILFGQCLKIEISWQQSKNK